MRLAKFRFTQGMLIRIAADIVLINASILLAIFLNFLVQTLLVKDGVVASEIESIAQELGNLFKTLDTYRNSAITLTIISVTLFFFSGFYTYGRTYHSRFKVLVILQGVTLSYLIFGFLNYMFSPGDVFSRGVWILGWLITLVVVSGARLWSTIWKRTVVVEAKRILDSGPIKIRKVLVIGGAGYLGSVLIRKLLAREYQVRVLDLLMYGDESIRDLYAYERRFQVRRGDFRSVDVVVEAMDGIDAVVHLGAIVGDPACQIDEQMTFDINLMSTKMIAEAAKGLGVRRFVFASSCSTYGASDELLTEKSVLNPQSLYAKTKIASEQVLQALDCDMFIPVILRFATLYGMSYRARFDLVINLLTAKAFCDREITVLGGSQWRPFVHVSDAAEAVIKAIETPLFNGSPRIYNVGSFSQNYQIRQIGQMIQRAAPHAKLIDQEESIDLRNYKVSFERIQNTFAFKPRYSVKDGIQEIIDAFQAGIIDDYRYSKYNNYKFLSEDHHFERFKFDLVPKDLFVEVKPEAVYS